jgi:symplekin
VSLYSINNGYDTVTWDKMLSIKQRILQLWENAVPSVRISCIKFAQRVVLAQTVTTGAEYRVRIVHVEVLFARY